MNKIMLVNKTNLLDKNYIPNDLVMTDNNENNFHNYKDPNQKPQVVEEVYEHFKKIQIDALRENIILTIDSGYRSYEYQQTVLDSCIKEKGIDYAKQFVAPPGASEHQTGLAIDVAYFRNNKFIDDVKDGDLEIEWMKRNAYKYGFILRYPKGKENITGYSYEPWHYRYVGRILSNFLFKNDLTLEEYYQNKIEYDALINEDINTLRKTI